MQWRFISGFLVLMAAFLFFTRLSLAVPGLMNYQGKLNDGAGNPIDGVYDMQFHLCDSDIGGTCSWTEDQTVTIADGIYNVQLGSVTAFPASLFDTDPLWLEVSIYNASTTSWETFEPRIELSSVPYAMKAEDADTVGGFHAVDLEESIEIDADIATHASISNAHHSKTTSFTELTDTASDAQIPDTITVNYAAEAGDADTVDGEHAAAFATSSHTHDSRYYTQSYIDALEVRIANLESIVNNLTALLSGVTRNGSNIHFSGVNVHVDNGSGNTNGAVNGLGNLIVGYNEERFFGNDRTGSHNIVVGMEQNYSSYGGLVAGLHNTVSGAFSSVSGGHMNTASGLRSSVSGGSNNTASSQYSSVSGGTANTAGYYSASVSGGAGNTASNFFSSVSGGRYNIASGEYSFVGGGGGSASNHGNEAFSNYSAS